MKRIALLIAFFCLSAFATRPQYCQDALAGKVNWLPGGPDTIGAGGFAFFSTEGIVDPALSEAMARFPHPLLDGLRLMEDGTIGWPGHSASSPLEQRINWYVPRELDFFPRDERGLRWVSDRIADAATIARLLPEAASLAAAATLKTVPAGETLRWNGRLFLRCIDIDDTEGGHLHTDGMYLRTTLPFVGPMTWIWDGEATWASNGGWASVFSGRQRIPAGTEHFQPSSRGRRVAGFLDFEPR